MIAVDTNILVYANRADSPHFAPARAALQRLAHAGRPWASPWSCLHEFISVTTHTRLYDPPSTSDQAWEAVSALLTAPGFRALTESPHHADILRDLLGVSRVTGPRVYDARIAATCIGHGVTELWTADRDFSYFPALRTHNPLVG